MYVNLFSYPLKMMRRRIKMRFFIYSFLGFFLSFSAFATELPMTIAVLRGLDKVTGRISTFSIPVGEVGEFGKLSILPEACYTRPPEESPENSAFLYVFEKSVKGENIELFKGWMFSSNPALSSMEHPVYDIWILECKKQEGYLGINGKSLEKKQPNVSDELPVVEEPMTEEENTSVVSDDESSTQGEASMTQQTGSVPALLPSVVEMDEL